MLHAKCIISRMSQLDFSNVWYEELMYQEWPYHVLGIGKFVYFQVANPRFGQLQSEKLFSIIFGNLTS